MPEFQAVRMANLTPREREAAAKEARLLFRFNQSEPYSLEQQALAEMLFERKLPEDTAVCAPLQGVCFSRVQIGAGVYVGAGALMMARGSIVIEDKAMLAANVSLLTNNHDPYDRDVLLCSPIRIGEGAWIGAGATILPGIRIGRLAVVGAAAVVTKDVPDYAVVAGNPARLLRMLDPAKFV